MPVGYRVNLGGNTLDPGDSVGTTPITFTTAQTIGTGNWSYTYFNGFFNVNTSGGGTYYLATDGYVYFDPSASNANSRTIVTAQTTATPAYTGPIYGTTGNDAALNGTDGDDTIYGGNLPNPTTGTGNDTISGRAGDDTIFGGDGADVISGGTGSDSILGGSGNDTLDGGGGAATSLRAEESLNWNLQGADEAGLEAGFTQNTGAVSVAFSYADDGAGNSAQVETGSAQYVAGGEPFATNSSLELRGTGTGPTSTAILEFSGNDPDISDEVANVRFRINDVDTGGWQDRIVILAYDADGNSVPVTLTAAGNDTVSGNTITSGPGGDSSNEAAGSVLVQIAGPVARIEIVYSNLAASSQLIFVTDIHFQPIEIDGADTLDGGTGNDAIVLGGGDIGRGGDGNDTFTINGAALTGAAITVVGGEGAETGAGDTLDLTGVLQKGSIVYSNLDDGAGGLSGTATLIDGSVLTFSEIETIICFTAGTMIRTPGGERPIETLKPGDMVTTLDRGAQPLRWIGRRTVPATGVLAPIRFATGSYGNHRDLLVSPQHRMLCRGYAAQLLFGETEVLAPAKSLVDDFQVTIDYGGMVTYVHMLFDRHEIVIANGAPSESFYPGSCGLDSLSDPSRDELFRLFPALRSDAGSYGPASRTCLKGSEARALAFA